MEKISRYILVFVGVVTLAVFLPKFYWMIYERPVKKPFIQYSCIINDFMIQRIAEKKWVDAKGNNYSRDEYEQRLPLMFYKQLLSSGTMPDSINGKALDTRIIAKEKSFFRIKANEIDAPAPVLFPLFESQRGRVKLDLPDDFFRITWRMEIINASANQIQEEKSQMFSAVLYHRGFSFPAKCIYGLATPRKTCDEGYLVIDSKDQLFHLKMVESKPFVKKVDIPDGLKFKHISCVDFKNKAFYAYLFSDANEIYILSQNDYKLIKWPVEGYDPACCDLKIYGDLFNYTVNMEFNDHVKLVTLDKNYRAVDSYTEKLPVKEDMKEGRVFDYLFPAQVSITSNNSKFIRFDVKPAGGWHWILLNLALLAVHILLVYWKKESIKAHLIDFLIVGISGVFGFIAIHIFKNKFY